MGSIVKSEDRGKKYLVEEGGKGLLGLATGGGRATPTGKEEGGGCDDDMRGRADTPAG